MIEGQKICSRCIIDSTVPNVRFDERGVCNYCKIYKILEKQYPLNEIGQRKFKQLIEKIRIDGKGKEYDCVVGVSGGLDSSYTLYLTRKLGLRPLAVHLDNNWDSEIAINNIKKLAKKLDVDLRIITVDWEEFKDLQLAFLKASTPDVEIPTDIAIQATLYKVAAEEGVRYVIDGHSFRTEGVAPLMWMYADGRYIESVYKRFSKNKKLQSYPNLTISKLLYYVFVKKIRFISLLEYTDYRKEKAKKILKEEVGWEDYGVKHYESVYTRFIQSYLLPKKFNIDKRKVYFSALIRSGQMTREEALEKIKEPPISKEQAEEDKKYILKKLELTEEEFEEIMRLPPKVFLDYPTYYPVIRTLKRPIKLACKLGLLPYTFYAKYLGWNE